MALITRVTRLFAADMNAVIDQIEEPEMMLKQSLREMQETLAVSEQRLKNLQLQLAQVDELLAQAELDRELPTELYAAVAEILSWIYRANTQMKEETG